MFSVNMFQQINLTKIVTDRQRLTKKGSVLERRIPLIGMIGEEMIGGDLIIIRFRVEGTRYRVGLTHQQRLKQVPDQKV